MKIQPYQIPFVSTMLAAATVAARRVAACAGMTPDQATNAGIGIMLIGIVVMSIALTLGLGLKKDGDK